MIWYVSKRVYDPVLFFWINYFILKLKKRDQVYESFFMIMLSIDKLMCLKNLQILLWNHIFQNHTPQYFKTVILSHVIGTGCISDPTNCTDANGRLPVNAALKISRIKSVKAEYMYL